MRRDVLGPPAVGARRHHQIQHVNPQVVAIDNLLRFLIRERTGARDRNDLWFRIPKARVRDVRQERQRGVM